MLPDQNQTSQQESLCSIRVRGTTCFFESAFTLMMNLLWTMTSPIEELKAGRAMIGDDKGGESKAIGRAHGFESHPNKLDVCDG